MMFGSTILEVATGVMFVYLLLSLLCSALGELIESFVRFRARDLERGIRNLLDHPQLAKDFFNHPLIKPLGKNPSYISARTFSMALWNLATTVKAEGRPIKDALTQNMDEIRSVITALDDHKYRSIKISILTLMDEAGNDLEQARANIEGWYNDAMDRVSGWYKRRMQWILIVIGLVAAAILNIDTISVARALWFNETLRGSVAIAAESYIKNNPAAPELAASAPESPGGSPNPLRKLSDIRGQIYQLGMPVGWVSAPELTSPQYAGLKDPQLTAQYQQDLEAYRVDPRRAPRNFNDWLLKLLGIFLTALAVSQGAPFWFDLLNKFMVIRSTVKPQEKSQVQPSKDRLASEIPKEPTGGSGKEGDSGGKD